MSKAADIMAAATPGRWTQGPGVTDNGIWSEVAVTRVTEGEPSSLVAWCHADDRDSADARAIVTAVNLFPLYEAVREAARTYLWSPDSFDDYDPADVPGDEWAPEALALRAALDALQAAEDAL